MAGVTFQNTGDIRIAKEDKEASGSDKEHIEMGDIECEDRGDEQPDKTGNKDGVRIQEHEEHAGYDKSL